MSPEKRQSWIQPAANKLVRLLSHRRIRNTVCQHGMLDLRTLLNKSPGCVILYAGASDKLGVVADTVTGMFLDSVLSVILERANLPEAVRHRHPIALYLDEAENVAGNPSLVKIAEEGRRLSCQLVLAHQNIFQLPKALRETVRNNFAVSACFQCGSTDAADLARDVVSNQTTDSIRKLLLTQPVGSAIIMRRGFPSVQAAIRSTPVPNVLASEVEELRLDSFRTFAKPRAVVEEEIGSRRAAAVRYQESPRKCKATVCSKLKEGQLLMVRNRFDRQPIARIVLTDRDLAICESVWRFGYDENRPTSRFVLQIKLNRASRCLRRLFGQRDSLPHIPFSITIRS